MKMTDFDPEPRRQKEGRAYKAKLCGRDCAYRVEGSTRLHGCNYCRDTGHTKVKQIYRKLKTDSMTDEARKLLSPKRCPFYRKAQGENRVDPRTYYRMRYLG